MIKRLQNFRGAEDPLMPTMKRVIAIISKERHRLTKNEMRELMKPLRITSREQEAVLEIPQLVYEADFVNKLLNSSQTRFLSLI